MSTALAHKEAPLHERLGMSKAQLELLRTMCVHPDAPDEVVELYFIRCKSLGADPFAKLIYVIPRSQSVRDDRTGQWRKEIRWTFQSSIDLFRSIAEASEDYAGQLGPFWSDDGEKWLDYWMKDEPPALCRVGVLRHSFKEPLYVTVSYNYYVPKNDAGKPAPTAFWKGEKGAHQLAKCCEELALRKAFPKKLAQLYGNEEMNQAEAPAQLPKRQPPKAAIAEEHVDATFAELPPAPPEEPPANPDADERARKAKRQAVAIFARQQNITEDERHEIALAFFGSPTTTDARFDVPALSRLQELLESWVAARAKGAAFSEWMEYALAEAEEARAAT